MQTAVASLCSRVQAPNQVDYTKLRVLKYISNTKEMTLTIILGEHPSWWVNSYYAVNLDMQSHSGIFMTLGKGAT